MAAWLVKSHGDGIIGKLDPDVQKIVKTVVWRDNLPLHPEEVEIEDASKMKIDWLIDIKELEMTGVDDKSITMDDASVGSFGSQSFFSATQSQNQESLFQNDTHQSLALREQDDLVRNTAVAFAQSSHKPITTSYNSDSDDEEEVLVTDTTDADAQSSQSVEDYGRSSALEQCRATNLR